MHKWRKNIRSYMSDYRVCGKGGNCLAYDASICPWQKEYLILFKCFHPMICPKCHGILSDIRTHNGKKYRHCYACHFEFEEKG